MLKEKNILYIVHNYTSFQKDQIEETAKHFKNVYVLVRYKPITTMANLLKLKILQKYKEENCIDRRNLPANVHIFKTPVTYIPYGLVYKQLGKQHYKAVQKVVSENKLKFDIVHAHFIWSSGYAGMKIAEEYGVPFVVTGHGYDVYSLPFKDAQWTTKFKEILHKADKILTISAFNKSYLDKLLSKEDKEKVSIVYNGFNPSLFYPVDQSEARLSLGLDISKRICVTAGNLIRIKGFSYLITAMSLLPEEFSDVNLYIVGAGSRSFKLSQLIQKYGLKNRVFLVGIKPHEEIPKWINAADIFAISSLKEGAPVVLLEALACGIPVAGTKVGIVEETLESPEYGYVCNSKDAKGLSEAIQKVLSKEWDRKKIAKHGKQFTWVKASDKIVRIYYNLLKNNE